MRLTFICLVVLAGLVSCKKEELDISSFWNCHQSQNLDSTALSNKLAGSWTWAKQSCFWTGKTTVADKNITVTFTTNGTFTVNENSTTKTQGTWNIVREDGNSWRLDQSPGSDYLYGHILFCGNQVLFNDSHLDGCDNLFNKRN